MSWGQCEHMMYEFDDRHYFCVNIYDEFFHQKHPSSSHWTAWWNQAWLMKTLTSMVLGSMYPRGSWLNRIIWPWHDLWNETETLQFEAVGSSWTHNCSFCTPVPHPILRYNDQKVNSQISAMLKYNSKRNLEPSQKTRAKTGNMKAVSQTLLQGVWVHWEVF